MLWRLASAWGDSPPRNSCTTWRLNSIECVRCLAMGFLLESPVQLADSQGPYLSTSKGALHTSSKSDIAVAPRSVAHCSLQAQPNIARFGDKNQEKYSVKYSLP